MTKIFIGKIRIHILFKILPKVMHRTLRNYYREVQIMLTI